MSTGNRLQVAVVVGCHPFDVPNFARMLGALDGIDTYIQDLDNWVHDWGNCRRSYDAVAFYHFHQPTPDGAFADAVRELGSTKQGIVVLHHAILAWPGMPEWSSLCGIQDRSFGYHMGQSLRVNVAIPEHPIVAGLDDWDTADETYTMDEPGPDCHVLLTTNHEPSMRSLAWTRRHGQARVFCLQLGHDAVAWQTGPFAQVLERGIKWSVGAL